MNDSLKSDLRYVLPAWLACILFPLPVVFFWRSDDGQTAALWFFFIGCASLVAYIFRRDINRKVSGEEENPERVWRRRMTTVAGTLLSTFIIFSLLSVLSDPENLVAVFVAFLILVPSFCVVPCLVLVTRSAFAGVVLSLFLVFCMKLLGCVVVVLVYGWHATDAGYTAMPWTQPNLLVWLFWFNSSLLSISLYRLGAKRFRGASQPNPKVLEAK